MCCCAVLRGRRELSLISGGFGERETPLPIPNRAVKPLSADGTWPERARESRTPPVSSAHEPPDGRLVVVVGRSTRVRVGTRDPLATTARTPMPRLRVAVDVGGTFTDVFVLDEDSSDVRVAKVPSTPADPMEGVMEGVAAAEVDLGDVSLFSHGTTVATNALITRRFEPAAMVTTRNFRDVLEIRRG